MEPTLRELLIDSLRNCQRALNAPLAQANAADAPSAAILALIDAHQRVETALGALDVPLQGPRWGQR